MANISNEDGDEEKCHVYKLLVEVFELSLLEADFTDSIHNLTELYKSFSSQGFESSFKDILMLTISESKRSKDVQKIFTFISDFVVSLDNKHRAECMKNKQDDEENEFIHPFLKYLFKTLYKWSEASSYVVRFRSCQLLYMILTHVLDSGAGEIDVNTYEKIANLIQIRRKDVSANVRAHSVLLAKFFQDPSDHNDPVIAALCWQLETDPNAQVRKNILDILAACEETIIPVTRRFLYDKNSLVRNSALLHICHRISPRSYTAEFKILILNQCFQDTCAMVRRNAAEKLIPMWFRAYGDKFCAFFKNLRLGNDCLDKLPFIKTLVHQLFKLVKISQIIEEIDLNLETALPKSLDGDKIFIWRNFYLLAYQQEKLKKFIPQPEALVEYIIKHFKEAAFEEAYAYNELISFSMDAFDILGEEHCETLPAIALDVMKNLFIPRDVIPYAVALYCDCSAKETKEIHKDIFQAINELMKFIDLSSGEEQKNLLIKCLNIYSETLAQDNVSLSVELIDVKDTLVLTNLDSNDIDIKREAFRSFSLYCLLDHEEARQFWSFIKENIHNSPDNLKLDVMKGVLDILKCHGCKVLGEPSEEINKDFEKVLEELLLENIDTEIDIKLISKGMLKLYLSHHIDSPVLLAKVLILMFEPDNGAIKNNVINFLELFGESSKEAECLTRSFLIIINILFNAKKSSLYFNVSIKTAALQLLDFAKLYENGKNFEVLEKFEDLLVLKLTRKFIKKPWRLTALDLQEICSRIMPTNIDILNKLYVNVQIIIESFDSSLFQKNPFSKKSKNFFLSYLKKIQAVLNTVCVDVEMNTSRRVLSSPENNSFLKNAAIEFVSPMVQKEDNSF